MYTSYYGLSAKPFQLSPDPTFFFGSSGHRRALAYLRYGLSQAEGFIVVTGGIGTGKTTLVQNLLGELGQEGMVAAQLVTTQLAPDDLLRMVVGAFGLPTEGAEKAFLLQRFENFLHSMAREGKRCVLLVDEAQNLTAPALEELRMLSNYQGQNRPLLQSLLLGQEEFRTTLQSPQLEQLRQRVIASCHLNPLNEEETEGYIEHRLGVVGWKNNPVIDESAYQAIFKYTQGVPRKINVLCDRLLLHTFIEGHSEIVAQTVHDVRAEMAEPQVPLRPPQVASSLPPSLATTPLNEPQPSATAYATQRSNDNQRVNGESMSERLAELERNLVNLTLERAIAPKDKDFEALKARLERIEPAVESLREGFSRLADVIEKSRANKVKN